jgi:exodeoxyribonuclease X
MSKILILDSETTGLIEPIEAVEVAWQEVIYSGHHATKTNNNFLQRYKPTKPIEYGALATSHILMSELVDCPPSDSFKLPEDTEYLIGQNIQYDWNVIGKPDVKLICTKALAQYVIPDIDSYSQSALLYYILGDEAKPLLKEAHNAQDDINNCYILFSWLISQIDADISTIEKLYQFSEKCKIPTKMPFGKHKDMLIKEVPKDYISWLLKQPDLDSYLVQALKL